MSFLDRKNETRIQWYGFSAPTQRERLLFVLERVQAMTEQVEAHLKVIYCIASRELRAQRLRSPVAPPSQWKVDAGPPDEQERHMFDHLPMDTLVLDTSQPFEACLDEGLAYLQR